MIYTQNQDIYLFRVQPAFNPDLLRWDYVGLIIFGVIVIIGIAFLVLRRMMAPVTSLKLGSDAFGAGNLDYRISVKSRDEFSALADSFNQMAAKIKTMIEAKEQLLLDVSHELRSPIARMRLEFEIPDGQGLIVRVVFNRSQDS